MLWLLLGDHLIPSLILGLWTLRPLKPVECALGLNLCSILMGLVGFRPYPHRNYFLVKTHKSRIWRFRCPKTHLKQIWTNMLARMQPHLKPGPRVDKKKPSLCVSVLGSVWTPANANADVIAPHQLGDVRVTLCCCICFCCFFNL